MKQPQSNHGKRPNGRPEVAKKKEIKNALEKKIRAKGFGAGLDSGHIEIII